MSMFARFDENPAMTLQVIKKKNVTDGRTDNVKTVYPTTNKVCGGYNNKGVDQTVACGDFCRLLITLANSFIFVKMACS